MQFAPSKSCVHEERVIRIRLLGTGATDPTVEYGPSMTVLRTAVGVHRITLLEGRGTFIGIGGYAFGAATPGDVKGQTITRSTWDATNRQLSLSIWSSTFAADELNATEYLDVSLIFADTNKP